MNIAEVDPVTLVTSKTKLLVTKGKHLLVIN